MYPSSESNWSVVKLVVSSTAAQLLVFRIVPLIWDVEVRLLSMMSALDKPVVIVLLQGVYRFVSTRRSECIIMYKILDLHYGLSVSVAFPAEPA